MKQWIFGLLLWSLLVGAAAASPVHLGPDLPYTVVAGDVGGIDPAGVLPALREGTLHTDIFSRGYTRTPFWLRVTLPAALFDDGERWLEVKPNFIDDIRFFYRPLGSEGPWRERRAGDRRTGPVGDIDYRFPVFVLPASDTGYELVARVASSSAVLLQLDIWEPEAFLAASARGTGFWSFYFGLAALSALLALVLAIVLKSRLLWSVTAISAAYVLVACIQGYVAWLIPGVGWWLQHYLTGVFTLLSYGLLLWMSSEALHLSRRLPWAHHLLMAAFALSVLLLLSIPLDQYSVAIRIQSLVYLTTGSVFVVACLYVWWRDHFRLSSVLLGVSPLVCMIASLAGLFSMFGWIPFKEGVYVIWQYALMVNMLMVTGLAVYQVRIKHLQELEKSQLAQALQVEREARFNQRQFMGMVAHEFRTPLAIIAASLQNLRYLGVTDRRQVDRYDKIGRATDRLVQLTDNCLADARLASEDLLVDRRMTSLSELITASASLVQVSGHHWKLTFDGGTATPDGSRDQAWLDPALMRIALSNVIDNGMKYGGGTLHVDLRRGDDTWQISIRDRGPGINVERVPVIFERYRRGTPFSPDDDQRGVGLGLYVSRHIARAHGGDLTLADNGAGGCCFVFTLPIPQEVASNR